MRRVETVTISRPCRNFSARDAKGIRMHSQIIVGCAASSSPPAPKKSFEPGVSRMNTQKSPPHAFRRWRLASTVSSMTAAHSSFERGEGMCSAFADWKKRSRW